MSRAEQTPCLRQISRFLGQGSRPRQPAQVRRFGPPLTKNSRRRKRARLRPLRDHPTGRGVVALLREGKANRDLFPNDKLGVMRPRRDHNQGAVSVARAEDRQFPKIPRRSLGETTHQCVVLHVYGDAARYRKLIGVRPFGQAPRKASRGSRFGVKGGGLAAHIVQRNRP